MNEIEKAIEDIKNNRYTDHGIARKSIDLAISALEKQIPKKVLGMKISLQSHSSIIKGIYGKCPICNEVQVDDEYCQRCGQKLDWSVDE